MEILVTKYMPDSGEFHIVRELTNQETGETSLNLMILPEDAMEWRAAEYQIEPSQTDLLMDIVLYEVELNVDEAAINLLYVAPTIQEARERHIERVMAVKEKLRPQGPNKWKNNPQRLERLRAANPALMAAWSGHIQTDALKCIRDNHVMEHEVLQEKALNVDYHRRLAQEKLRGFAGRGSRTATAQQRVERLRAARMSREGMEPR